MKPLRNTKEDITPEHNSNKNSERRGQLVSEDENFNFLNPDFINIKYPRIILHY